MPQPDYILRYNAPGNTTEEDVRNTFLTWIEYNRYGFLSADNITVEMQRHLFDPDITVTVRDASRSKKDTNV